MSTSADLARLRRYLRAQDGVVSLDQVRAAGLSPEAVRRRLASREWVRLGPRVFGVADHHRTPRSRVYTAVLSVGGGATLVGTSAAWWWQMSDEPPPIVDLAVHPARKPRVREGVRVRRRIIDPADRLVLDGVGVTKRAPTLLAASADLGRVEGARLLDKALQRGPVELDQLREVHARTSGRWGATLGAELLDLAAGRARSEAERVAHRELRDVGVRGWSANLEVRLPGFGLVVLDVAFPAQRIVVEVDGWAYHRDLRAFLRDGPRQTALALAGWTVLRTNWYELTETPWVFVEAVRTAVAQRSEIVVRRAE